MSRHSWSEVFRDQRKTERECSRCHLIKVTRHEYESDGRAVHWIEWYRAGERIDSDKTPMCEGVTACPV